MSRREGRSQKDTMRGHNRDERGKCVGHRNKMRALGTVSNAWKIPEGDYMVRTWSNIEGCEQGHRNKKMS